ncbi:DNA glycosylase [Clavulina sp. PMI_390]|nr:DNA glycosylase [Clavulina sp. PMI_390]
MTTPMEDTSFAAKISRFAYTNPSTRSDRISPRNTVQSNNESSRYQHDLPQASSSASTSQAARREAPQSNLATKPTQNSGKRPKSKGAGHIPSPPDPSLPLVDDIMGDELDVLFCGINPGITTSKKGHPFAHRSNRFWPALYAGGITDIRLRPEDSQMLPLLPIRMGVTNLCARPSKLESDLSSEEHAEGAEILLKLLQARRPRIVCFVGMGLWKAFFNCLKTTGAVAPNAPVMPVPPSGPKRGSTLQPENAVMPYKIVHVFDVPEEGPEAPTLAIPSDAMEIVKKEEEDEPDMRDILNDLPSVTETILFVMPNTSGLVTSYKPPDYANFISSLKQRVFEVRAGLLDTSSFATLQLH